MAQGLKLVAVFICTYFLNQLRIPGAGGGLIRVPLQAG